MSEINCKNINFCTIFSKIVDFGESSLYNPLIVWVSGIFIVCSNYRQNWSFLPLSTIFVICVTKKMPENYVNAWTFYDYYYILIYAYILYRILILQAN